MLGLGFKKEEGEEKLHAQSGWEMNIVDVSDLDVICFKEF